MLNRRSLSLLAFSASLLISTLMCDIPGSSERSDDDILLESQNMTSIAVEATRFSRNLTETAQASITPTTTSTPTPAGTATPTSTSPPDRPNYTFDSLNLPPPVFSMTDLSGDTYVCASGNSVNDPAVDILSVNVYDPQSLGATHSNYLTRVELGVPANITFANDWSASVLAAHAPSGAPAYTLIVYEIHAGQHTQGTLDESGQTILPNSANSSFIDDQGNIWFLMPPDTMFMQFASFHLPSEDLPPEQKRCDIAPNDGEYTLDLP